MEVYQILYMYSIW